MKLKPQELKTALERACHPMLAWLDPKKLEESASAADIVQLALWLAEYDGQTDLWADIDAIVRGDHLARQVSESDLGIVRADGRTITERWLGGWGVMLDRDARDCTFDVHAAVVHVLCDVYTSFEKTPDDSSPVSMKPGSRG